MVKPGTYKHFKGGIYRVIGEAKNSESQQMMVIYVSVDYPDVLWVRPLSMWNENVDRDGYEGPRFTFFHD